jgi:hypothetical protein
MAEGQDLLRGHFVFIILQNLTLDSRDSAAEGQDLPRRHFLWGWQGHWTGYQVWFIFSFTQKQRKILNNLKSNLSWPLKKFIKFIKLLCFGYRYEYCFGYLVSAWDFCSDNVPNSLNPSRLQEFVFVLIKLALKSGCWGQTIKSEILNWQNW